MTQQGAAISSQQLNRKKKKMVQIYHWPQSKQKGTRTETQAKSAIPESPRIACDPKFDMGLFMPIRFRLRCSWSDQITARHAKSDGSSWDSGEVFERWARMQPTRNGERSLKNETSERGRSLVNGTRHRTSFAPWLLQSAWSSGHGGSSSWEGGASAEGSLSKCVPCIHYGCLSALFFLSFVLFFNFPNLALWAPRQRLKYI